MQVNDPGFCKGTTVQPQERQEAPKRPDHTSPQAQQAKAQGGSL